MSGSEREREENRERGREGREWGERGRGEGVGEREKERDLCDGDVVICFQASKIRVLYKYINNLY